MDDQNRNLLLAMVLSTAVLFVWFALFPPPEPGPVETETVSGDGSVVLPGALPSADTGAATSSASATTPTTAETIAPRIDIETPSLTGAISLSGEHIHP